MKLKLTFGQKGYIADPYRTSRYQLIEIQKKSGMMRTRSDKKRREALEAYLTAVGLTLDDYQKLEKKANEPFYYSNGAPATANADAIAFASANEIIIPADNILSCLVNACDEAPARVRIQNVRCALTATDFRTGKTQPDGKWERFVVVTGAQGKLSNQRAFRSNEYISNFSAIGEITHDPEMVDPKALLTLLVFAGKKVGIGASRGMGWGRFTVQELS